MERTGQAKQAALAATFGYSELIRETTKLDPEKVQYYLLSQRLLRRDAYIEVGPYCFRLTDTHDQSSSETKRFKKGASKQFVPTRDYETTELPYKLPIHQSEVIAAIEALNPRREKACANEIVAKGRLIALVKLLDQELKETSYVDVRSPFERSSQRLLVITDWINWFFLNKYKIKSSYSREQVRQMIKNENCYSGRFQIGRPDFDA